MDYAPDLPIRTPDLLYDVNSLVPDVSGNYQTAPTVDVVSYTLLTNGNMLGAAVYRNRTDDARVVVGSSTKLYTNDMNGTGNQDFTGSAYSVATSGYWTFAMFGDALVAANGVSVLQVQTSAVANFTDIAGSPKAKIVLEHENALVALNINGNPDGWACSDTADYTQWSSTPSNNADSGNLYGGVGGQLTAGAVWQKQVIAFKSNAMYIGIRVEEVDQAIHWEKASNDFGCVNQFAQLSTELGLVFVSNRDILIYDGSKPRSIADKVRRTFLRSLGTAANTVFLSHDELEKNIYLWYPPSGSYPSAAYVFNYTSFKWGKVPTIQTNGTSYSFARRPVVGASATDLRTFSAGYVDRQVNAVIIEDGSSAWIANVAHKTVPLTRHANGKPSLTTGYFGTPGDDKTFSRLLIVPETSGTNPESATVSSINEAASVNSIAASINDKGMVDKVSIGRYFQVTATWPTSTGKQTITELVPEFKEQTFKPASKGR